MPKLALYFICKNESHIVKRMLKSALPITDLIVVNDTGSTDGTQEIIRRFGQKHKIPTFIFERPFDDFGSSREFSRVKLLEVANQIGWNLSEAWGFCFDCDEKLAIDTTFMRDSLDMDMYFVHCFRKGRVSNRMFLFRLSANCRWFGAVHERLEKTNKSVLVGNIYGLKLVVEQKGNSWKGDLAKKFLGHAKLMEDYLEKHGREGHFLHTTGQCLISAASYCKNKRERELLYKKGLKYFIEAEQSRDIHFEERYSAQMHISSILYTLRAPWEQVESSYLKAHEIDPVRAEPFHSLIAHQLKNQDWDKAYLYSKWLVDHYQGNAPMDTRGIRIIPSLYGIRALCTHIMICYFSGRIGEGKALYKNILEFTRHFPDRFTYEDLAHIYSNRPSLIKIKKFTYQIRYVYNKIRYVYNKIKK